MISHLLPLFVLLTSAVPQQPSVQNQLSVFLTPCTSDTGGDSAATIIRLTPQRVIAFGAVQKALAAYWKTHKERHEAALRQTGKDVQVSPSCPKQSVGCNEVSSMDIDYTAWVRQDTVVAAIFTHNHFAPEQFIPTEVAVSQAIWVLLDGGRGDTSTIVGKNLALVQAHRVDLAVAFQTQQLVREQAKGLFGQMMQGAMEQSRH